MKTVEKVLQEVEEGKGLGIVKKILRGYKEKLEKETSFHERKEKIVKVFTNTFKEEPEEVGLYTNGLLYAKRVYAGDDELLRLTNEIICLSNRLGGGYFKLSSIGEVEARVDEESKAEESDWSLVRECREDSDYGTYRYYVVFEKAIPGYTLRIKVAEKWDTSDC